MPEGLERLLPHSDVRWRQDVRLLEQGRYDEVRRGSCWQGGSLGKLCGTGTRSLPS